MATTSQPEPQTEEVEEQEKVQHWTHGIGDIVSTLFQLGTNPVQSAKELKEISIVLFRLFVESEVSMYWKVKSWILLGMLYIFLLIRILLPFPFDIPFILDELVILYFAWRRTVNRCPDQHIVLEILESMQPPKKKERPRRPHNPQQEARNARRERRQGQTWRVYNQRYRYAYPPAGGLGGGDDIVEGEYRPFPDDAHLI